MATVPDLWPTNIRLDAIPPVAVLRAQAGRLGAKTDYLLEAEVVTTQLDVKRTDSTGLEESSVRLVHRLQVIAHALEEYKHELLSCEHDQRLVYPTTVRSVAIQGYDNPHGFKQVYDQNELIEVVGFILSSGHTRSVIQSLLAAGNNTVVTVDGSYEPIPPQSVDAHTY